MKKLTAAFALSFAISMCLVPCFAIASDEGTLSTRSASLDTQMTEGNGWIDVINGPTFAGPNCTITIEATPGAISTKDMYSYFVQFRIYKSDELVAKEEFNLDDTWYPKLTFKATSSGNYRAEAYVATKSRNKYTGSMTTHSVEEIAQESFTVTKAKLMSAKVTLVKTSAVFTGKVVEPKVKSVVLGGKTLKPGTDYTVKAPSCKNKGSYQVTVIGTGSYEGTVTTTYKITKATNKLAKTKVTKSLKSKALKVKSVAVELPKAKFGSSSLRRTAR